MKKIIDAHYHLIEKACASVIAAAASRKSFHRGGTDGAVLSYMGLPCPNLGTGGHNFLRQVRIYFGGIDGTCR
jgi:tripeptide aminopeptidase